MPQRLSYCSVQLVYQAACSSLIGVCILITSITRLHAVHKQASAQLTAAAPRLHATRTAGPALQELLSTGYKCHNTYSSKRRACLSAHETHISHLGDTFTAEQHIRGPAVQQLGCDLAGMPPDIEQAACACAGLIRSGRCLRQTLASSGCCVHMSSVCAATRRCEGALEVTMHPGRPPAQPSVSHSAASACATSGLTVVGEAAGRTDIGSK